MVVRRKERGILISSMHPKIKLKIATQKIKRKYNFVERLEIPGTKILYSIVFKSPDIRKEYKSTGLFPIDSIMRKSLNTNSVHLIYVPK